MFGRKKKEEKSEEETEPQQAEEPEKSQDTSSGNSGGDDLSLGQAVADVEKLKAQFTSFYELQKAATERFTRINEQIGELRAMIIDRDRASQHMEAKATQAIDLVQTIQPDKLMIELRKQDGKVEALRANLESNEAILKNAIAELKDMRNKMTTFKGLEEVVKLSQETKKELMSIQQVKATVERHADKVETIFSEMQKGLSGLARSQDLIIDLDKTSKILVSDVDSIKIKMGEVAEKKDVENLLIKVNDFEERAGNVVTLTNKRFEKMKAEFDDYSKEKFDRINKLLVGFEMLAKKTPDLDKYFNLLTAEAKKLPEKKVEKLKEPGEEPKEEQVEKKGLFSKFKKK
ncbi:MAG: hypothetical protein GY861_06925 [bacterium]|nr:hypothetical protein [bacterium]